MAKNDNDYRDMTDYSIPDRSHGDLYCALCESHMNSEAMWQAHIIGKKHTKNLNKEGDVGKKYETLNQPCNLQEEIDGIINDVVVGLKHVHEIYRKNTVAPIYMCYLCNSNVSIGSLLIEHVLSYKHRLAYVKENDAKSYNSLDFSNFSKGALEDLVFGMARNLEVRLGRGNITVKKEIEKKEELFTWSSKNAPVTPPLPPGESFLSQEDNTRSSGRYQFKNEMVDLPRRHIRSPSPRRRIPSPSPRRPIRSPSPRRSIPSPSHRSIRSPSRRSIRSPSRRGIRSPSASRRRHSPSPHRRARSPPPTRRARSPSPRRSPDRRQCRFPAKRARKERKDKSTIYREKHKNRSRSTSSSGSTNSPSHKDKRRFQCDAEGVESSHGNRPDISSRIPNFNVLHHSPVQQSARMVVYPSFIPTSAESSVKQALLMNLGTLNTLIPTNNEQLFMNNSVELVKRMVMELPAREFLDLVYSKLDNLLFHSTEDIQIVEDLHLNIGKLLLSHRRNSQTRQNIYTAASVVPPENLSENHRFLCPANEISARDPGPQPLDAFLTMVRKNGLQPTSESQNLRMRPGSSAMM